MKNEGGKITQQGDIARQELKSNISVEITHKILN